MLITFLQYSTNINNLEVIYSEIPQMVALSVKRDVKQLVLISAAVTVVFVVLFVSFIVAKSWILSFGSWVFLSKQTLCWF